MVAFGKSKGGGRRSAARASAPLVAVYTTLEESKSALVVDVSATGARLRAEHLPLMGAEMFLTIDQIRAFGTVIWSDCGDCGVEFDERLLPEEEELLRERVDTGRGLPPDMRIAFENWVVGCGR